MWQAFRVWLAKATPDDGVHRLGLWVQTDLRAIIWEELNRKFQ